MTIGDERLRRYEELRDSAKTTHGRCYYDLMARLSPAYYALVMTWAPSTGGSTLMSVALRAAAALVHEVSSNVCSEVEVEALVKAFGVALHDAEQLRRSIGSVDFTRRDS